MTYLFLEYLVRIFTRAWELHRTKRWFIVTAKLTSSECQAHGLSPSVVKLHYEYVLDGSSYKGTCEKSFLFETSGQIYMDDLSKAKKIRVRVNPADPAMSVLADIPV